MTASALIAFRLVTADPERLIAIYPGLGFTADTAREIGSAEMAMMGLRGRGTRYPLRLHGQRLELDCFEHAGRPYPKHVLGPDTRFQHLALATGRAGDDWTLAEHLGARPISAGGPVTLPDSSGGVTAVKFRDPEGHPLELIQFPSNTSNGRTCGIYSIDHTAISVSNAKASQLYYERFGLTARGPTLNYGLEQASLDGLEDASSDVVPMWTQIFGPHLELLGYRHPASMLLRNSGCNDIAATRVVWSGGDNCLLRDPDGHLHQIANSIHAWWWAMPQAE